MWGSVGQTSFWTGSFFNSSVSEVGVASFSFWHGIEQGTSAPQRGTRCLGWWSHDHTRPAGLPAPAWPQIFRHAEKKLSYRINSSAPYREILGQHIILQSTSVPALWPVLGELPPFLKVFWISVRMFIIPGRAGRYRSHVMNWCVCRAGGVIS